MNGIIFNKPIQDDPTGSFLDQVKKNEDTKKRQNLKLISTIILSNIFVAYLFYSPPKTNETPNSSSVLTKHPGHKMMVLNIVPLLQLDMSAQERKITLLNNKKKIVLTLGFLHDEVKNDLDPGLRRFKIEIPEHQTLEIGALSEEKLIAIPAIESSAIKKVAKGSAYEINL